MKQIKYQKILVTHDGSELASTSIPHAVTLAKCLNAAVLLIHVVRSVEQETAMVGGPGIAMYPVLLGSEAIRLVKENKRIAKRLLEKFKEDFESKGVKNVSIAVKEGSAEDVIIYTAKTENCDLIVMSTHGRSGWKRTLLGSVADHVIRHSACPVFVVNPKEKGK